MYEKAVDRESAYEVLKGRTQTRQAEPQQAAHAQRAGGAAQGAQAPPHLSAACMLGFVGRHVQWRPTSQPMRVWASNWLKALPAALAAKWAARSSAACWAASLAGRAAREPPRYFLGDLAAGSDALPPGAVGSPKCLAMDCSSVLTLGSTMACVCATSFCVSAFCIFPHLLVLAVHGRFDDGNQLFEFVFGELDPAALLMVDGASFTACWRTCGPTSSTYFLRSSCTCLAAASRLSGGTRVCKGDPGPVVAASGPDARPELALSAQCRAAAESECAPPVPSLAGDDGGVGACACAKWLPAAGPEEGIFHEMEGQTSR